MMHELITGKKKEIFKVPSSAEEFEMYSTMEGVEIVAQIFLESLLLTIKVIDERMKQDPDLDPAKVARTEFKKYLEPLFTRHREFGTSDSEVFYKVQGTLSRYIRKVHGYQHELELY